MRVLIDALSIREGGGITYMCSLLEALSKSDHSNEYQLLLSKNYQENLLKRIDPAINKVVVDLTPGLVRRWFYQQKGVPRLIRSHGYDLLLTLSDIGAMRSPCPHVVVAHNMNIYAPINTYLNWRKRYYLWKYRITRQPWAYLTLQGADRIVFVSQTFRRQVTSQIQLKSSKTRVVYHGVSPIFNASDNDNMADSKSLPSKLLKRDYLLSVSSLAPHKSDKTLLSAFGMLAHQFKHLDLVIAGDTTDKIFRRQLDQQARATGYYDRIHFLGFVQQQDLPKLYRNATAFIFPSRLETFGLPLVEAMASGTPVLSSDLPVCREICQHAALYFRKEDAAQLADQIKAVLGASELGQNLREKGFERARQFSWERAAVQMKEIIGGCRKH